MKSTILDVDDNPDDIEITKLALEEVGRRERVKFALYGEDALALLRDGHKPSLILLDLKIPGLRGIDTLRQIRSTESLKDIPIIVVTSSSLESDVTDAYEAGANGYLRKVFDIGRFSREMKTLLDRNLPN